MLVGGREQAIDLGKLTGREGLGKEQIPRDALLHPPLACTVPVLLPRQAMLSPSHTDLLIHWPPAGLATAPACLTHLIHHSRGFAGCTLTIRLVSSWSGLVKNMFSSTAWTAHREPGAACSWSCTADPAWASLSGNPTLTWSNTPGKEYERGLRRMTDRWHRQKEAG